METLFYDLMMALSDIFDPLNVVILEFFNISTLTIVLVTVSSVAAYKSLTDLYAFRFNKVKIFRNVAIFVFVLLLVSGMHGLLYLSLIVFLFLNMFVDVKETADKRFIKEVR